MMSTEETLSVLPGERGLPSVNASGRSTGKKFAIATFFFVTVLSLFLGLFFMLRSARADNTNERPVKELTPSRPVIKKAFSFAEPPPRRSETYDDAQQLAAIQPEQAAWSPPPVAVDAAPIAGGIDKGSSPLMVAGHGRAESGTVHHRSDLNAGGTGALDGMLSGTRTQAAKAYMMPDRNFLLAKGASFKCQARTRLVSTVPGMTACTVTRDIYSDNGKVVLIPRGSRVVGEYRADLQRGAARIGVLFTQIDTPDGIRIPLNSPGADALGAAGVPGYVDDHFWQRFGGAILLSLIDDTAQALGNANQSRDGQVINFRGTGDAMNDVAAEAIKNTINIPPTLYVNQGDNIVVFVARDLDFSDVYELMSDEEE
jgi:type IV secretion system protein VirB10